jgi:GNAT superfamily N-acetyltransferase
MSVATMRESDRDEVISTLVSAFVDDPVERWMFPDPKQYSRHFPEFVAAFASEAFDRRTVWTLGELSAVALWLPPDAQPDGDAIVAVLSRSVSPAQHADLFSVLAQMDEGHPTFPHWYLPWLGVRPAMQGAGLGGRLLTHCLTKVDADHVPAFLETPNPRTVPFYERLGFEVTSVAQAGACPPVTLMLRASR